MDNFSLGRPAQVLIVSGLLLAAGCHPYRIPNPTGPPVPKVKQWARADVQADDAAATTTSTSKPQRNAYDKDGLVKKPQYKRRRVRSKPNQRTILGIKSPF